MLIKCYQRLLILSCAVWLVACSINKKQTVQNTSNKKVSYQVKGSSSKKSVYKSNRLVYLKMNNHSTINSDLYEDQLMKYLLKRKLFRKIITRSPSLYINMKPEEIVKVNDDYWFDRSDPLNNDQITRYFLKNKSGYILETYLQGETMPNTNRYNLVNRLAFWVKLIDAKNKKTLFYARSTSNNKLSGLYEPVFNKLANWLR